MSKSTVVNNRRISSGSRFNFRRWERRSVRRTRFVRRRFSCQSVNIVSSRCGFLVWIPGLRRGNPRISFLPLALVGSQPIVRLSVWPRRLTSVSTAEANARGRSPRSRQHATAMVRFAVSNNPELATNRNAVSLACPHGCPLRKMWRQSLGRLRPQIANSSPSSSRGPECRHLSRRFWPLPPILQRSSTRDSGS